MPPSEGLLLNEHLYLMVSEGINTEVNYEDKLELGSIHQICHYAKRVSQSVIFSDMTGVGVGQKVI